jgi:hypothetical protein
MKIDPFAPGPAHSRFNDGDTVSVSIAFEVACLTVRDSERPWRDSPDTFERRRLVATLSIAQLGELFSELCRLMATNERMAEILHAYLLKRSTAVTIDRARRKDT